MFLLKSRICISIWQLPLSNERTIIFISNWTEEFTCRFFHNRAWRSLFSSRPAKDLLLSHNCLVCKYEFAAAPNSNCMHLFGYRSGSSTKFQFPFTSQLRTDFYTPFYFSLNIVICIFFTCFSKFFYIRKICVKEKSYVLFNVLT